MSNENKKISHLVLNPYVDKNSFRHQNTIPHLQAPKGPKGIL